MVMKKKYIKYKMKKWIQRRYMNNINDLYDINTL